MRYNLRYQAFLLASDALILLLALIAGSVLRLNIDLGMPAVRETFYTPPLLYPIAPLLFAIAYAQAGVYTVQPGASWWAVARRVALGHLFGTLLFVGALYLIFRDFSRLQAAYVVSIAFAGVLLHRAALAAVRGRLLRYINTPRCVLIVGTGESARRVGDQVRANAAAGLRLVGYVGMQNSDVPQAAQAASTLETVGTLDDLPALVRDGQVQEIIIAVQWFDKAASDLVSRVMRLLEAHPVNIRLAPDYSELAYFRANPEDFGGIPLVGLRESVLSPAQRIVKRLMDIGLSLFALVVTAPIMGIIALLIRLDSPGAAIFRQPRIGQHGRRFIIYKFRTMRVDADRILPREQAKDVLKAPGDPRVTRVGAFLRRTSLDELPQFLNVLRGEMSIVGPRPEVVWIAEEYQWWQRKRFEVPQGMTGWWQVNGRSDKPMRYHIEEDLWYVRNYSIWLDLQIIARTAVALFTRRGAY